MQPKIVVTHGESGSVFSVVDVDAPEAQQPAILAAYRTRIQAEQAVLGAVIFGSRYFALGSPTETFE